MLALFDKAKAKRYCFITISCMGGYGSLSFGIGWIAELGIVDAILCPAAFEKAVAV